MKLKKRENVNLIFSEVYQIIKKEKKYETKQLDIHTSSFMTNRKT